MNAASQITTDLKAGRCVEFNRGRLGFSLIELMLVMAILVLVAALSAPSIQQTFAKQALEKGADRVRVAMGQARVRSIKNGDIYAVFFLEGGAWFNVAPFSQVQQQAGLASSRQNLASTRKQSNFEDDLLPQGVKFAAGITPIDARAAETLSTNDNSGSIRPILFYPDGTSQDAKLVLQNEKGNFVELQLRGLTGLATKVRLKVEPTIQ